MTAKRGSATPLLLVVAFVSVLANVHLLRKVGQSHLERDRASANVCAISHVREIAQTLGMSPGAERTDADIAMDIKLLVGEAPEAPKTVLTEDNVGKMSKLLKPEDRKLLKAWRDFAQMSAGRRCLIIAEE